MKRLLSSPLITISAMLMLSLTVTANAQGVTPCAPALTNAVATFLDAMKGSGYLLQSSSYSDHSEEKNGITETISGADLLFSNSNHKVVSVASSYSETEFAAAKCLMDIVEATYVAGIPPTNTTYQTDFTVLSRYARGIATKHASVILISTNFVADVRTSSDNGDSSQDMIQVIKKVETMRDAMRK